MKMMKIRKIIKIIVFGLLIFAIFALVLFFYYGRDLPRPEKFTEKRLIESTKLYDRTGEILLYDIYGEEKREIVSFSQVPDYLKNAVLAAEDAKFYRHRGLDFQGVIRAFLVNIKIMKPAQGASTITQQLIRSSFLTRKKTLERKIREIILTLELERRYSKDQILEWYLNQVPFGENAYGVGAASQAYFRKHVSDISLQEAAVLAALIQAPSALSPYGPNKDDLLARKGYILDRMAGLGFISEEEKEAAKSAGIEFTEVRKPIRAPHFVLYIKSYLERKYGEEELREKGFKVYTTIDWELQSLAEETVVQIGKRNEGFGAHNAALVAIDPRTGEILSMVGSKNFFGEPYPRGCQNTQNNCLFEPEFNVATLGKRQPGSSFKPFVYATAFKKGYLPQTLLWDVKTEFNPYCDPNANQQADRFGLNCYSPQNYDGLFRGQISLKESLAQSINLTSVKLLYLSGVKDSIKTASDAGITTLTDPDRYGLSLVLGGGEVKLLEMVSGFGVFATDGFFVPATGILKVEDSNGRIVEENRKGLKRVLDTESARMINEILSDNQARTPVFGPNSVLHFPDYQVAAKTGTTQDFKDGWTIGYTPSVVTGVWVGNNNNTPMLKEPGIVLAGPIWRRYMEKALSKYSGQEFKKPVITLTGNPMIDGNKEEKEHSILYYIDKSSPLSSRPEDPTSDPQYLLWERGVQNWLSGFR